VPATGPEPAPLSTATGAGGASGPELSPVRDATVPAAGLAASVPAPASVVPAPTGAASVSGGAGSATVFGRSAGPGPGAVDNERRSVSPYWTDTSATTWTRRSWPCA